MRLDGELTSLRQLHIANNDLTCLPTEIGCLTRLQVLEANNRIWTFPSSIGECTSLVEVDLSSNILEVHGNLQNLKALYLSNNCFKSLPPILSKICFQLSTLDLLGLEITSDLLRQFEGWDDFDEQCRLKHHRLAYFGVGEYSKSGEVADCKLGKMLISTVDPVGFSGVWRFAEL